MADRQNPDGWLVKANKGWQQRAESEKIRADSAERWAFEASAEVGRLSRSRQLWRRLTISGWAYCGGYVAIVDLHWSRWTYVGSGLLAAVVTATIETVEDRRRRRKRAEKRKAGHVAWLAEDRQRRSAAR